MQSAKINMNSLAFGMDLKKLADGQTILYETDLKRILKPCLQGLSLITCLFTLTECLKTSEIEDDLSLDLDSLDSWEESFLNVTCLNALFLKSMLPLNEIHY